MIILSSLRVELLKMTVFLIAASAFATSFYLISVKFI